MAKEVKAKVKIQLGGGTANPGSIGSALGPHGINMMDFCKQFNAQTATRKGETVPVIITIYKDRSFDFVLKTAPTSELIKKKVNVPKGSARPNTDKIGKISWADVEEIVKIKLPDLNAVDVDQAKKIVAGTARSMGIDVV